MRIYGQRIGDKLPTFPLFTPIRGGWGGGRAEIEGQGETRKTGGDGLKQEEGDKRESV
jgi:hypothetical protein